MYNSLKRLKRKAHRVLKELKKTFNKKATTLHVLTTLPRSGTHWLKSMISEAMEEPPLEKRLLEPSDLISALNSEASRRLIYEHFDYDIHAPILDPNIYPDLRIVLLFRNPLDTLISNFHFRAYKGLLPDNNLSTLENLKLFLRGYWNDKRIPNAVRESRLFSMSYRDYVRRCAVDWLKSGCCFPIRYEDLVSDPQRQLMLVLDYLNVSHSLEILTKVATHNSFQVLSGGRSPGIEDPNSHYRKGIPGEWREVFDNEDLKILSYEIGDYLDFLGYPLK